LLVSGRIEKSIELKAPVSRVWRALTDHLEFGEWFRVKLEGPFVPGQEVKGMITWPGYEHVVWSAVVQKMEPERLFSFVWPQVRSFAKTDAPADYSGAPVTLVEFKLQEIPSGTLLTVTESGFESVPADWREEAFRRNDGGWTQQMKNIESHVTQTP
jgi:uncharacterized protein YndB with AHSA1/START domain